MLTKINPEVAKQLLQEAQNDVSIRWQIYQYLATRQIANATQQPASSSAKGIGVRGSY